MSPLKYSLTGNLEISKEPLGNPLETCRQLGMPPRSGAVPAVPPGAAPRSWRRRGEPTPTNTYHIKSMYKYMYIVDSRKLEHGCRMVYAGSSYVFGFGWRTYVYPYAPIQREREREKESHPGVDRIDRIWRI